MSFHVGQQVECIDASLSFGRPWDGDVPVVGAIYTVGDIVEDNDPLIGDMILLRLVEIRNVVVWQGAYAAERFRPVTKRKSSVNFTIGADPESERWDNRVRIPEKTVSHHH